MAGVAGELRIFPDQVSEAAGRRRIHAAATAAASASAAAMPVTVSRARAGVATEAIRSSAPAAKVLLMINQACTLRAVLRYCNEKLDCAPLTALLTRPARFASDSRGHSRPHLPQQSLIMNVFRVLNTCSQSSIPLKAVASFESKKPPAQG